MEFLTTSDIIALSALLVSGFSLYISNNARRDNTRTDIAQKAQK